MLLSRVHESILSDHWVNTSLSSCRLLLFSRLLSFLSPRRLPVQHLVCRPPGTSADDLQEPVKISIPRHVLRGQGKDEHFEFEVKVSFLSRVHLFITSSVIYVFLPLHLLMCCLLHHPSLSGRLCVLFIFFWDVIKYRNTVSTAASV